MARTHVVVLLGLTLLALLVFGRAFGIKPFGEDNFYTLQWVDRAPASALLRVDPEIYPEWRPLAFQTMWLQYRAAGIDRMADYYIFNIAVWVLAAWMVYRVVLLLVPSVWAAAAAAALVLVDRRAIPSIAWIIERQSSMACLLGLLAVFVVLRAGGRRLSTGESAMLVVLLIASALSKEYGLAFAGGLAAYAFFERRSEVTIAAIVAGLAYAGLRLAFAGGGVDTYCEDMGYFFTRRHVCYLGLDGGTISQMAYNVAATGLGTIVPGLFSEDGQIALTRSLLPISLVALAVMATAWRQGPRALRLAAWIIAGNTALSFMLYQSRNQLVGVCAAGIVAGVGLALIAKKLEASSRVSKSLAAAALLGLIGIQAARTQSLTAEEVDQLMKQDPCAELVEHPEAAAFAARVRSLYGEDRSPCPPR